MTDKQINPQQLAAVTHKEGPLLIIAGAGTGKTTVVTERIKHLILNQQISPRNILALTFTEKAAKEMEERVDISLPYGYTQMWIATFHAFCERILKEEAYHIGLDTGYKLLSDSESLYFLQSHIFDLGLKLFKPLGKPHQFLETLLAHFSRLADEDITAQEYLQWVTQQENFEEKEQYLELAHAYLTYTQIKIQESVMEFPDLISNTLLLFRKKPEVLKKYQKLFSSIFVDEFQDTNYAQNELAILLAGEKKNITVVADDDQSIYRFRGAAVSNVLQFTKKFPEADIVTLTQNYRSTQTILDSSYQLIQHNNPNRLEVVNSINKKLHSNSAADEKPIEFIHTVTGEQEADEIAKRITELIAEKYSYSDIAILVRANNHAHQIIATLKQHALPHRFVGPEYLLQQEEIKDFIAYLMFLSNLSDSVSLFRVLSMDIFNIPAIELNYLLNFARKENRTLFEVILANDHDFTSEQTKKQLEIFITLTKKHLEMAKKTSVWNVLYDFLLDSKLMITFSTINSLEEEKIANNIIKFFDLIKKFETGSTTTTLHAFIDWLNLMLTTNNSPRSAMVDESYEDAVNILTVHASKGLEYKVVFMVSLVADRFPSRERSEKMPIPSSLMKEQLPVGEDFHLEEERRLFYVGMTRAKERLFFTAADFYGEAKRMKKLSPFIFEAVPDIENEVILAKDSSNMPLSEILMPLKNTKKAAQQAAPYKVTYITFSNLQSFDVCPLHYKAKVILRIPTPPSANQSSGISIHKALYSFYKQVQENKNPSKEDLLSMLQSNWVQEGYFNRKENEESFAHATELLKAFYEAEGTEPVKPLALELPFDFKLKSGIKASGTIDRIDQKGDGIEIIDYKTGKDNPKAKKAHDEQLALYALAATRIKDPLFNYSPEQITLTIHFLQGNTKHSIHLNKEDLDIFEDKLITTIAEIEKSDFACSKSPLCANCEYKMLCKTN